jgi:hypothetical protein
VIVNNLCVRSSRCFARPLKANRSLLSQGGYARLLPSPGKASNWFPGGAPRSLIDVTACLRLSVRHPGRSKRKTPLHVRSQVSGPLVAIADRRPSLQAISDYALRQAYRTSAGRGSCPGESVLQGELKRRRCSQTFSGFAGEIGPWVDQDDIHNLRVSDFIRR